MFGATFFSYHHRYFWMLPSTSQGEPEMLKGINALGTNGILLKDIQELKAEIEELKNK